MNARMKRLTLAICVVVLVIGALVLVRQMQSTASDSKDAETAAKLREQLYAWFQDNKEYPLSLEQVWNQGAMRDYRTKYGVPDERRTIFSYTSHSNWYELSFTNFGAIQTQIGSNGVAVR
jgi:hypothetical protein